MIGSWTERYRKRLPSGYLPVLGHSYISSSEALDVKSGTCEAIARLVGTKEAFSPCLPIQKGKTAWFPQTLRNQNHHTIITVALAPVNEPSSSPPIDLRKVQCQFQGNRKCQGAEDQPPWTIEAKKKTKEMEDRGEASQQFSSEAATSWPAL